MRIVNLSSPDCSGEHSTYSLKRGSCQRNNYNFILPSALTTLSLLSGCHMDTLEKRSIRNYGCGTD